MQKPHQPFLLALSLLAAVASFAQQIDPPSLVFTQVSPNTFNNPIRLAHASDGSGRIFILEQSGGIWIIQSNTVVAQPFLNLAGRGDVQQMFGVAFPPGYATNHHFYVSYVRNSDYAACVSRFQLTADPNVADMNSEQVLLTVPTFYGFHAGGQLAFGPDGFLYIGFGDGGYDASPQTTLSLLGKLLRIDVEGGQSPYSIPANNPFVGNTNYAPEIWALGLRNPQTFSFDRATGDLYTADSGSTYQEINFQPAGSGGGQNYGWPIQDGPVAFQVPSGFDLSTLTQPVAWYDHTQGSWVNAGYVYRGPTEPRMDGVFFYGDIYYGRIGGLEKIGTNWLSSQFGQIASYVIAFGEDDQGNLYLVDGGGKISKIQDSHEVLTPSFSPSGGTIYTNLVTVICLTPGAAIHYTTNGLDPAESDLVVSSGAAIQVSDGVTNKIRAFRADLTPSPVVGAIFNVSVATPVFTPQSPITNGTSISISCATPGAVIYYTLDGSTPTASSPVYAGPLIINSGTTVSAIGVAAGYANSAVTSFYYALASVATPAFNPPSSPVTYGTGITISCTTPGAVIYYTVDGTTPTTNSPLYSSPVVLPSRAILLAQAFRSDMNPSEVQGVSYNLSDYVKTVITTLAGGTAAGYSNAPGLQARFSNPQGLCLDRSGNLYVADTGNNVIRKISPAGQVTTFAGTGVAGAQLGAATNAQFSAPTSVAIDGAGNIYVADAGNCNRICKIGTNGMVTLLASWINCLNGPTLWQMESDPGGNLYVGSGQAVDKISPNGTVTRVAGIFDQARVDSACEFGWCFGVGLGIDAATNLYITTAALVYKQAPGSAPTLFAGSATSGYGAPNPGYSDGPNLQALFAHPQFVIYAMPVHYEDAVVDSATNVFVSDDVRVRKISPAGWVSTMAGTGDGGYRNGPGSVAQFNGVTGLCVDTNGILYVADAGNNCIRTISPDTYGIGIPDWWQLAQFGYVGIDPNADPDHDGMSNFAEFIAGTNPNNPNSCLRINSAQMQSGGLLLNWAGGTNAYEYLQRSASLGGTAVWQDIFTNPPALSASGSYLDTAATQGSSFYRIRVGWQ